MNKTTRPKTKHPPNLFLRGGSWIVDFYFRGRRFTENLGPVSRTVARERAANRRTRVAEGELAVSGMRWAGGKWIAAEPADAIEDLHFEDALEKYLEYYKTSRRPRSYARHVHSGKNLSTCFAGKRLSEISAFAIEKYKLGRKAACSCGEGPKSSQETPGTCARCGRLERSRADATVNRELALLRNLFNLCIKWGFALKNPASEVKMFEENNARKRYLRDDELRRLLDACGPELRVVVLTAVHTGLRSSELKSLLWANVDLANRFLTVESAYSKNGETRTIPLNTVLTAELERLKIERLPEPEDTVFLNRDGKPWKSWRTAYLTALKAAGISGFTFHDLRHCFGSYLAMADVNEKARMELMGHKRPEMTMRYTHLSLDYKRAAVAKLEKLGSQVTSDFTTAEAEGENEAPQVAEIKSRWA